MKSFKTIALSWMLMLLFAFAMVTASSNVYMNAEEELLETIHNPLHAKQMNGQEFRMIFDGDQGFILASSLNVHLINRNNEKFSYEPPLIDIPLMPPELTA